ncbi:hypothetical protein GCM10019059_21520 [Camelimonas fluminis]|nr:hypothetical protein GCM10019059_21520 [Camelimonas fluminis]
MTDPPPGATGPTVVCRAREKRAARTDATFRRRQSEHRKRIPANRASPAWLWRCHNLPAADDRFAKAAQNPSCPGKTPDRPSRSPDAGILADDLGLAPPAKWFRMKARARAGDPGAGCPPQASSRTPASASAAGTAGFCAAWAYFLPSAASERA